MNVLVLGGGAREHALVKALKASPSVSRVSCAQGNPGIALDASCHLTDPSDIRRVVELARRIKPDVIVVGPEAPLAIGVSDALRQLEFNVFGPSMAAARLESSKVYSKEFMINNHIPTARALVCKTKDEVMAACQQFAKPWVVKADGLAAGKGVRICETPAELEECATDFFDKKILGAATSQVLVEEYLEGTELSLLLLVADGKYEILPISQDHKRLKERDKGPNTGGMGAFAPVKKWAKKISKLEAKIIAPVIAALKKDHADYKGVLYIGVMMKADEPYVIEFNVRFGDPECQVIMPLLDGDWGKVFCEIGKGRMPKLKWKNLSAVAVVLAASGYPENPQKGARINIDRKLAGSPSDTASGSYILHASTASHNGYFANGGRVLNTVGVDKTLTGAAKKAYALIKAIEFEGMHYRRDIALTEIEGSGIEKTVDAASKPTSAPPKKSAGKKPIKLAKTRS